MAETITVEVKDPVGLYLTPVTVLVNIANNFYSDVKMIYEKKEVNLKSMMAVISLGVPTKAILSIQANGDDELAVIAEMKKAITSSDIGVILH